MDPNIPVQLTPPIMPEVQVPVSQPIVPPAPEQPVQPKPKLSKWVIVVIVILLLLIVGGISAYILNISSMKTVLSSPTPIAAVSKTPTPTPDPTINLIEYIDKKYGFSIKYPKTWSQISMDSSYGSLEPNPTHLGPGLPCKSLECNTFAGIVILVYSNPDNLNAKQYAQQIVKKQIDYYKQNAKLSGTTSAESDWPYIVTNPPILISVDIAITNGWAGAARPGPHAYIRKDNIMIELASDSIDDELAYQIFSTFKITQ